MNALRNDPTGRGAVSRLGAGVLCLLSMGAWPGAQAAYPNWNGIGKLGPFVWTEQTGIRYAAPANGSTLDTVNVCRPVAAAWPGPFPAILLIHGGAWVGGSNAIGTAYTGYSSSWCQIFASWGFVAYSVGYRLEDNTSGNDWPAALVDVQAAVRWVRARAHAGNPDNVNPSFIGAMGDSAGGSLTMQIGSIATSVVSLGDPVASTNLTQSPRVQFTIAQFAPFHWGPSSAAAPVPATALAKAELINGGPGGIANALMVEGTKDTTVSPSESVSAYCYLQAHKNGSHYLSYVGAHEYIGIASADFSQAVGTVITAAVSYAMHVGHMAASGSTPPIPAWFTGPQTAYDDAVRPVCLQ